MISSKELLNKIKSGKANWLDFSSLFELEEHELEILLKLAYKITIQNFGNQLKIYTPNKRFPAISITGNECALGCEHCNKKYLEGMEPILDNSDLENFLKDLAKNGGVGALISGGCEPDGSIPLTSFLNTIKKIKNETDLIINTHTGLVNEETVKMLAEAKVDIVSFDINMDEDIIKNIYHLDKDLGDYKRAVELLKKYNLSIVPHLCIGLYYGKLHKELESIRFIKELEPPLVVLIALVPPKKNRDENITKFEIPRPVDIAKVIATIRFLLPQTEISLGCMRPRGRIKIEIEKYAIRAGITRIENPSKKTIEWLRKYNSEIKFKFYSACCAIPKKFESHTLSTEKEIKRYVKN